VRTLREEADRKYRREARKDAAASEAAEMLEFHVADQETRLRDQGRLVDQLEKAETELRGLETELKRYDQLKEDAVLLEGLRRSQRELEERRRALLADRRAYVAKLWRDALAPRLNHELERLERERSAIEVALTDLSYAEHRLADLQAAVDEKTCKTCGQPMPE